MLLYPGRDVTREPSCAITMGTRFPFKTLVMTSQTMLCRNHGKPSVTQQSLIYTVTTAPTVRADRDYFPHHCNSI